MSLIERRMQVLGALRDLGGVDVRAVDLVAQSGREMVSLLDMLTGLIVDGLVTKRKTGPRTRVAFTLTDAGRAALDARRTGRGGGETGGADAD